MQKHTQTWFERMKTIFFFHSVRKHTEFLYNQLIGSFLPHTVNQDEPNQIKSVDAEVLHIWLRQRI